MSAESVLVAGVGPGLGTAVAARLACEVYRVAMLARNCEKLEALAKRAPNRLIPIACDVTDPAQVNAAFDETERTPGTARVCGVQRGSLSPRLGPRRRA
jgi:NADP-dependent 3-hydroxy acid dehydrogenase YdfG